MTAKKNGNPRSDRKEPNSCPNAISSHHFEALSPPQTPIAPSLKSLIPTPSNPVKPSSIRPSPHPTMHQSRRSLSCPPCIRRTSSQRPPGNSLPNSPCPNPRSRSKTLWNSRKRSRRPLLQVWRSGFCPKGL